jgi:ribosomal protein S18 acetylase RimI-like enzyme
VDRQPREFCLKGTAVLKEPTSCTEVERREFERLVREGFEGSDDQLPARIRAAKWLAFYYAAGNRLVAIAGLKTRSERFRDEVFEKAGAGTSAADYSLELGWVYVPAVHRGNRIGKYLCKQLLECEPATGIFATTRPNNTPMIKILRALGFERVGKPYPRRDEELVLFLQCGTAESKPLPSGVRRTR